MPFFLVGGCEVGVGKGVFAKIKKGSGIEKYFLDKIKSIFNSFWRTIIWSKIKKYKTQALNYGITVSSFIIMQAFFQALF